MASKKQKPLFSLSLVCRIALNIHALNNEGNENNRLIPRRIHIVVPTVDTEGRGDYTTDEVNAISGDMFKHNFMNYLRLVSLDRGLSLCKSCKALHSSRMLGDEDFARQLSDEDSIFWDQRNKKRHLNGARVTDSLLTCVIDDIGGILIPFGDGIKRESPLDIGWIAGLPALTQTRQFTHTRHTPQQDLRPQTTTSPQNTISAAVTAQMNTKQMLFERPASSGVYALIIHFTVYDLSYNHYARDYPDKVDGKPIDRTGRFAATLLALSEAVRNLKGALTSTQLPHVTHIDGFVSLSTSAGIAAPMISPLQKDYLTVAKAEGKALEKLHGHGKVEIQEFHSGADLLSVTTKILDNYQPGQLIR